MVQNIRDWEELESPGGTLVNFVSMPKTYAKDELGFERLLETGHLSDVTIHVGPTPKIFHLHRTILASNSSYFEKLFYGKFQESSDSIASLPDMDHRMFKYAVWFLYTGIFSPNMGPVADAEIFAVAIYLDIPKLRDAALYWLWSEVQDTLKTATTTSFDYGRTSTKYGIEDRDEDGDEDGGGGETVIYRKFMHSGDEKEEAFETMMRDKIRGSLSELAFALTVLCGKTSGHDRHQQAHMDAYRKRNWPENKYFQILELCFLEEENRKVIADYLDTSTPALQEVIDDVEELKAVEKSIREQTVCSPLCYYCGEMTEPGEDIIGFLPCGFQGNGWVEESKWTQKEILFFDCKVCNIKRGACWECASCKMPKIHTDIMDLQVEVLSSWQKVPSNGKENSGIKVEG